MSEAIKIGVKCLPDQFDHSIAAMKSFFLLASVTFCLVNSLTWKNLLESSSDGSECDVTNCVQKCPPAGGFRSKLTSCLQAEKLYEQDCLNGTEILAKMEAHVQSGAGATAKSRMFIYRRFNIQTDVAEVCKANCGKAFGCLKTKCSATIAEDKKLFECLKQLEEKSS